MHYLSASHLISRLTHLGLTALCLVCISQFTHAEITKRFHKSTSSSQQQLAEKNFISLFEKAAIFQKKEFPSSANSADEADDNTDYDSSDEAEKRRLKFWQSIAKDLTHLDGANLSENSRINLRLFSDQITNRISRVIFDAHLIPFNSDSQFWAGTAGMAESARCLNMTSCNQLLKQFSQIERSFHEKIELMKLGIARGMTLPQVVLTGRDASIEKHVVASTDQSVFFNAFNKLPTSLNDAQRKELQDNARKVISEKVIPAYAKLLQFIREEYIPHARKTIAAYDLPNGEAYYRSQIFEYTTLNLSPEHIHTIGLEEVARIRHDMNKIIEELKFEGDFSAFLTFLRTDPQFYAKSPHVLLAEASYIAKRIDGILPLYFGKLPRKSYGIAPVPSDIAPTYTTGRYAGNADPKMPSNYLVNTSLLDQRPMWALPALTLHEAVPGHHLQITLAGEQSDQPEFRRTAYISAFGEGWALYAEHLGVEMGIYENPYQQFGRLVYEMWRAARLVVDTGMHAKGWSRDQALQFMRENTALSEHEITTEIDRYISWPAQALSYKLGEIKIRELRQYAEWELGNQFDIRDFHDHLLSLGSIPLSILDSEMRAWTNKTKQSLKSRAK